MRVLLVEDDTLLGEGLSTGLKQDGYAVDWMQDGEMAEIALNVESFDIMILDLGLPKQGGLQVLQKLRDKGNNIPVLILTARDSLDDRIKGLDVGADDYMVKPFDLEELNARMRALLRRSAGRAVPKLTHGDITLDPAAHEVHYKGAAVDLPPKEFAVLQTLLENVGRVISKTKLQETLYSWEQNVASNALEVHVHHLRKKLDSDCIRTIRGVGYIMEHTH
ncbi:response regulator [Pseudomonadota bacterium]